jgi:hypothetical protein
MRHVGIDDEVDGMPLLKNWSSQNAEQLMPASLDVGMAATPQICSKKPPLLPPMGPESRTQTELLVA